MFASSRTALKMYRKLSRNSQITDIRDLLRLVQDGDPSALKAVKAQAEALGRGRGPSGSAAAAKKVGNTSILFQGSYRKGHERDNKGDNDSYGRLRTEADPADFDQHNLLFKLRQDPEGGHRIAILLDWPADPSAETFAGFESADDFQPAPYDAIIGHIEGCPVYADLRQRNASPALRVCLELDPQGALLLHGRRVYADVG